MWVLLIDLVSKTGLSSIGRALDCKSKDAGSIPAGRTFLSYYFICFDEASIVPIKNIVTLNLTIPRPEGLIYSFSYTFFQCILMILAIISEVSKRFDR